MHFFISINYMYCCIMSFVLFKLATKHTYGLLYELYTLMHSLNIINDILNIESDARNLLEKNSLLPLL